MEYLDFIPFLRGFSLIMIEHNCQLIYFSMLKMGLCQYFLVIAAKLLNLISECQSAYLKAEKVDF
jgi:hypothetical protein